MRIVRSNLATATICSLAGIISTATIIGAATSSISTSALSYSTSSDVSFTFVPTLSIGLSTDSLSIDNLVPGNISDSNSVKVTVSSNTPYGYVLSAGVGSSDSTSTYYNTSNLVHEDSTVNNAFTSIDTNASEETLTTDNTWGYSTSLDNGTTWSTYSGLPSTTTKPLLDVSDPATPSTIDFKIAAKSSTTQASGTYNNVITFYAVGKPEPTLYDEVAKMSKGTQTLAQLQATITAPTTTDYTTDTSNSGVYEYNSSVFGEASDASNANKIYYYRGVLEPEEDQGEYGSDGNATTYPNYVRLGNNTCWRIVRTTGSGGVKMIYNGTYKNGTCANSSSNARISTASFNTGSGSTYTGLQYPNMHAVGYTYSNVAAGTTTATTLSALLGASGNDTTTNGNSSIIKQHIENWYSNNMVSGNYTSRLEKSAGYCNDRTVYNDGSYGISNKLAETTTVIPYGTSRMTVYRFGAFARNWSTAQNITLGCPRGKVDLYSAGSDNNGNNGQLSYPIALLTADEAAFAGSGRTGGGTQYDANSYLRSGNGFWLLSPSYRDSNGRALGFVLSSNGDLGINGVNISYGVRPAISLKPGTTAASGAGTATDPWVVPAP